MARKSRKNMPVAVAEPTDNLTAKAVLSMDKEAKPYQVGIYARLSFESEANKERDTVDTQIAYIREFINSQDDMVEVEVYADISVTGTTFERPEFDRMIQDIRAGRINTVITRDLSRLGRNYVEAGNYIERVFPFLDVRYIAITDDFDTARPGTDLSVPLKNIVNEYYSKDLSKKVETGKHSIWAQGGFSEGTPPYGYYRATDGSRKLLIDEEVSDNVVRIFNMFLDGEGYGSIAKTMQSEGILSPPKYRFYKAGKTEFAEKAREWHYSHVKEILQGEYYIGNIVHGKQRKALDTGRKNKKTDKSKWQRVENAHEPIIDKDTFDGIDGRSWYSKWINKYKRYLEIAEETGKRIAVITDNDHEQTKIDDANEFNQHNEKQHVFMGATMEDWTWEACVYNCNKEKLDTMIQVQDGAEYLFHRTNYGQVLGKMLNNKVDTAYQMLISEEDFVIPGYVEEAIEWLNE